MSPPTLPLISIAPFLTPTSTVAEKRAAAAALNTACTTHGFFYLPTTPIPPARLDSIRSHAKEFFHLPSETKKRILRKTPSDGGDGARGYQRLTDNITQGKQDFHEAVDFYRDVTPEAEGEGYKLLMGPNLYPDEPEGWGDELRGYWEELVGLGEAMMRAMAWALGYEDDEEVLLRETDRAFWVARVIGYPPLPPGHDLGTGISCGEHTDYGCTTFLYTTPQPGSLQVLSKAGEWINADPVPGAYVVNIGDMLEIWTNGLWRSTKHRVIHRSREMRVSVPFFYEPNLEAVVRPLGRCVERTGGVEKYGAVVYGEHLRGKVGGNFVDGEGDRYGAGEGEVEATKSREEVSK